MNFEIKSSRFYYMTKKSRQKVKYLENEKAFFIIFKGLSMKQITQLFLEGESPTLICILYYTVCFIHYILHILLSTIYYIMYNLSYVACYVSIII